MLYPSMDPNERFRARRDAVRRRKRRRRALVVAILLLAVLALAGGMTLAGKSERKAGTTHYTVDVADDAVVVAARPRPLPIEVRGVHVTGALASLPGKLDEYVALKAHGLNTIELDVKDEGGEIGFAPAGVPLARKAGAVRNYYSPRQVASMLHRKGLYLIGRVVVFQDPYLARARPDLAVHRPDGSIWTTGAGLAWVNPYERRVWDYNVSIAAAAARAGFDEIMLDYTRFPSDGDIEGTVYPGRTPGYGESGTVDQIMSMRRFADTVVELLDDLEIARATVVGLSMGGLVAMELGLVSPSAEPGETVFRTLLDFKRQLRGTSTQLIPWIQDWNYNLDAVMQQVRAARLQGAKGFLLWNANGLYTKQALAPPPS